MFLKLLAPFAPHISEELWASLGNKKSVHFEPWPSYDEKVAVSSPVTIVVQVGGKTRGSFEAQRGESTEKIKSEALKLPSVQKWTEGKTIRTVITVPDRLVNIVVL